MLFLFRTFKVALLLFHLLHFIDTFLLFPGKALYFIEVNLSDFSFSKDFPEEEPENLDPDSGKSEGDIIDEITGQMKLF